MSNPETPKPRPAVAVARRPATPVAVYGAPTPPRQFSKPVDDVQMSGDRLGALKTAIVSLDRDDRARARVLIPQLLDALDAFDATE